MSDGRFYFVVDDGRILHVAAAFRTQSAVGVGIDFRGRRTWPSSRPTHTGWTYDYLYARHGWKGLDGTDGRERPSSSRPRFALPSISIPGGKAPAHRPAQPWVAANRIARFA